MAISTLSIILDVVTVAVAVLFVIIGYHRGFIKSVVRLVGFIVSIVVAALISAPVAQALYSNLFEAEIERIVLEQIEQGAAAAATTLNEQISGVLAALPDSMQSLLSIYGVDATAITGEAVSAEALVPTVMDQVISPLCTAVLQLLCFLVLFIVLFIVIRLLGKLLDKVFSALPVIKQANGFLGAILGFAEGVLVLFVLCYGIQLYMTLTGADSLITMNDINSTYVLKLVMDLNPIL